MSEKTGTVVVITSADGLVQAVEGDFDPSRPAGFRVSDMQEMRATDKAWRYVIHGHCSEALATAILAPGGSVGNVSRRLTSNGWKVEVRQIVIGVAAAESPK